MVGSALRADLGSPCGERDAARSARSADPTQCRGQGLGIPSGKGKPEAGGMAGDISFGSRVSAVGYLVRVFRFGYSKSVVAPFRVAGGSSGWQVAGLFHSALNAVLNAVLHLVLFAVFSHRFSPLSGQPANCSTDQLCLCLINRASLLARPAPSPSPVPSPI